MYPGRRCAGAVCGVIEDRIMEDITAAITDKDDNRAYAKTKEIAAASELSPEYYPHVEEFASLLTDKKSYIRTRAFILICCQARWDTEGRIEKLLPRMLPLLNDPKPTVVRQCLNAVKEIIVFRPELGDIIGNGLGKIDLAQYKDSMAPLIRKDMAEVTELIEETKEDNNETGN